MIGSVLLLIGASITVRSYGWVFLLAFLPLWFLFGYFLGIPTIINVLRTRSTFSAGAFIGALGIHGCLYLLLVLLLGKIGMKGMESFFLIGGVVNAFSMPLGSLLQERGETRNS